MYQHERLEQETPHALRDLNGSDIKMMNGSNDEMFLFKKTSPKNCFTRSPGGIQLKQKTFRLLVAHTIFLGQLSASKTGGTWNPPLKPEAPCETRFAKFPTVEPRVVFRGDRKSEEIWGLGER